MEDKNIHGYNVHIAGLENSSSLQDFYSKLQYDEGNIVNLMKQAKEAPHGKVYVGDKKNIVAQYNYDTKQFSLRRSTTR